MFKNLINVLNFASSSPTGGGLVCASRSVRRLDDQTARALCHSPTCRCWESTSTAPTPRGGSTCGPRRRGWRCAPLTPTSTANDPEYKILCPPSEQGHFDLSRRRHYSLLIIKPLFVFSTFCTNFLNKQVNNSIHIPPPHILLGLWNALPVPMKYRSVHTVHSK